MKDTRGFTLLELMIVVVIISILAALAIPAYGRYAFRAHRADGQELLLRLANAQERQYATFNKYTDLVTLGYANPAVSEKGYYNVTMTVGADPSGATSQTFVAAATPVGAQANDVCGALSLDNVGAKLPAASDAVHNSNGPCW